MSAVSNTIRYLRARQAARAAGLPVSFTTDPAWLVHAAINRRAGWLEDHCTRAFAEANHRGIFPRRATLTARGHLAIIAQLVNTPRVRVYVGELGEWRSYLEGRLARRLVEEP